MAKKLFVPERMAKSVESSPVPTAISKGFENLEDPNQKNTEDPSQMDVSAIDRLPQPVGYRLLVIPYYMKKKSAGGIIIPDSVRERESFATVAAYVVKVGPDA